jgi:hypothetical protein
MTQTQSYIHSERTIGEKNRENRISLINKICQVFRFGFEEKTFTFRELKEACEFMSTLIGSLDRDAGDLCLLAVPVEGLDRSFPFCRIAVHRWGKKRDRHTKERTIIPY